MSEVEVLRADPENAAPASDGNLLREEFRQLCDLVAHKTGFQPSDNQHLIDVFRFYDKNGNGFIEQEELFPMVCELLGWDKEEMASKRDGVIAEFLSNNDLNNDGRVDYVEFVRYVLRQDSTAWEEAVRQSFEAMDVNGDGFIDASELAAKLADHGCAGDAVADMLKELDRDQDGKVSYLEFLGSTIFGSLTPQAQLVAMFKNSMGRREAEEKEMDPGEAAWSKLSARRQKKVLRAFRTFDTNGDGTVDKKELKRMLRAMGLNPTDRDAERYLQECDMDGDGTLDQYEFTILLELAESLVNPAKEEERVRKALAVYDTNGDGRISAGELKAILTARGHSEALTDEEAERILSKFDKDGDGHVAAEEIARYLLHGGM
ncbi:unnamed protein product [Pedinophyceae sp. YPF-701]|nr:unnamed protein product [Pedinophyceae sp. YPF-701]